MAASRGADKYQSAALGMGKNMGDLGAVSADVTQGWSTPEHTAKTSGQSWRARYSKNFITTGTNFSIAGYRYSTRGYYGMQDVLGSYGDSSALQDRRRNRAELTMSQTLGDNWARLPSVRRGKITGMTVSRWLRGASAIATTGTTSAMA